MTEKTCEFCKIVKKESPESNVYEDSRVMAFLDIRPLTTGHRLVIPKSHRETIYDLPEEEVAHLYKIVKRVALGVKKAVKADGITIIQQNEKAAGQEIFHLHVHVIPRYEGQKLPRFGEIPEANREKLDEAAKKIKQHV